MFLPRVRGRWLLFSIFTCISTLPLLTSFWSHRKSVEHHGMGLEPTSYGSGSQFLLVGEKLEKIAKTLSDFLNRLLAVFVRPACIHCFLQEE